MRKFWFRLLLDLFWLYPTLRRGASWVHWPIFQGLVGVYFMVIQGHSMAWVPETIEKIFASTDGGPRSRVCARETLRSTPIDTSGNFRRTCLQSNLQIIKKKLKIAPQGARGSEFYFFTRIFIYIS